MKKQDKWLVVLNPNAGDGTGGKDWEKIASSLNNQGIDFELFRTRRINHAIEEIPVFIEKGFTRFIVIGGDGTLNEVINGIFAQQLIAPDAITVSMIAVGTGNDWCRMYGIPSEYEKAAQTIKNYRTIKQDIGKVHYFKKEKEQVRYFANVAGIGFDAMVAKKTNSIKEKWKRASVLLYFYSLIVSLIKYKWVRADITIDGEKRNESIFSLSIGIGKYNGGGMKQLPKAVADDGLFDITLIRKISKFDVLRYAPRLYDGSFIKHSSVLLHRGKNVSVKSDKPVLLETDGESLGCPPFSFSILPKKLTIIVGEKYE